MKSYISHDGHSGNLIVLVSSYCFLSILYVSFSCVDCVSVCVFFIFFSHHILIHLPICLPTLLFSFSVTCFSFLYTCLCLSLPLFLPVPLHFASFFVHCFICSVCQLLALCCFSFSVSVFLQLSEFLSFCKLLCLFLSFFIILSYEHSCVCVCVRVCSHCVYEHA